MRRKLYILLATALLVAPAHSAKFDATKYAAQFDGDDNKLLDQKEIESLRTDANTKLGDNELGVLAQVDPLLKKYAVLGSIPVVEFKTPPQRANCEDQYFFLRMDVTSIPLLKCAGFWPDSPGASFSASHNNVTGLTSISANGGIAVQILPASQFSPTLGDGEAGLDLVNLALFAFSELNGTFQSTGTSKGYTRYGLKTELLFESPTGMPFDALGVSVLGYHMTNLATEIGAWGIEASFAPHIFDARINSWGKRKKLETDYYWKLAGIIDYYSEESGGSPGSTSSNFGWVGGLVGFNYVDHRLWKNGVVLDLTGEGFWDWENSRDALKFTASLDFNLDPDGRASLGIDYVHGRDRNDLIHKDEIKTGLKIKY